MLHGTGKQLKIVDILAHRCKEGWLLLAVVNQYGLKTEEAFRDPKEDHQQITANYIVKKVKPLSKNILDHDISWIKKMFKNITRAVRRISRLQDFELENKDNIFEMRRVIMNKNKKNRLRTLLIYKYGAQVPRGVKEVIAIDEGNKTICGKMKLKLK